MANLIGFIDETGVLQKDPNQRFFGLGFLKLKNTAAMYEELNRLKSRFLAVFSHLQKPFEFKFNDINRTNYQYYHDLVDLYFSFPQAAFYAFVIDKQSPKFEMDKFFSDVWNAYIGYSKLVIEKNVEEKDKICILADYLSKPKISKKYYEIEVCKQTNYGHSPVFNACMLESHASLFIQLVDVLIGSVVFDFRIMSQPNSTPNLYKLNLVELIRNKIGVDSLTKKITIKEPNCFSVWPFKMG